MRRTALLLGLALASPACKQEAPVSAQAPAGARPFTARDLAAASLLDARLASVTLEASRILDRLSRGERDGARELAPAIEAAVVAATSAAEQVSHPADRPMADAAVTAARKFAVALSAFAATLATDPRASPAPLVTARDELGRSVNAYRQLRTGWRMDQPLPVGAEQDYAAAKAEMEKAEMGALQVVSVAPRDEGHKMEYTSIRLTTQAAAGRARDAAARLDPALRDAATRWVDAQERSVQALVALSSASPAEQPKASLAYQAARVEALAALAEYARRKAEQPAK